MTARAVSDPGLETDPKITLRRYDMSMVAGHFRGEHAGNMVMGAYGVTSDGDVYANATYLHGSDGIPKSPDPETSCIMLGQLGEGDQPEELVRSWVELALRELN